MSDARESRGIGEVLSLIVHDLRNPVATISANVSFVRDVGVDENDPDVREALVDVEAAVGDLMRGLEQLGWIGRWLAEEPALTGPVAEVNASVTSTLARLGVDVPLEAPDAPVRAEGAGTPLSRMLEILVGGAQGRPGAELDCVRIREEGPSVVIELVDRGRAVAPELRDRVFTLEGQLEIKGRSDGRYIRSAGLIALKALAEAIGAEVEAAGEDGAAIFRLRLRRAE